MSSANYTKSTWSGNELITAADLNRIETGIQDIINALNSDVAPVNLGGTGLTASPSLLVNLASGAEANVLQASPRPGVTGTLPINKGGTGATDEKSARANLMVATDIEWSSPSSWADIYEQLDKIPSGKAATYYANMSAMNLLTNGVITSNTTRGIISRESTGSFTIWGLIPGTNSKIVCMVITNANSTTEHSLDSLSYFYGGTDEYVASNNSKSVIEFFVSDTVTTWDILYSDYLSKISTGGAASIVLPGGAISVISNNKISNVFRGTVYHEYTGTFTFIGYVSATTPYMASIALSNANSSSVTVSQVRKYEGTDLLAL